MVETLAADIMRIAEFGWHLDDLGQYLLLPRYAHRSKYVIQCVLRDLQCSYNRRQLAWPALAVILS